MLAGAALTTVPAAFAHAEPVMMMPAANSTVNAPKSVMIHFSEALEPKFSKITVTDAAGHVVTKEAAAVNAKMMTVTLPDLKPGVYTVHWTSVATDSHRLSGEYKFTVK